MSSADHAWHGIRIGNCSGFYGDRIAAMREMLEGGELDVLTGDYLAELTMLILGRDKLADDSLGYAKTFVRQLEQSLGTAMERGVKIVANAGGLNPHGLVDKVREVATGLGLDPQTGIVHGDDVSALRERLAVPDAVTANAYLGGFGIARALEAGADIVVTGRVTDASLAVGPAAWHHRWSLLDHDQIAGAMAAGHIIECGTQATGGNYAFFDRGEISDLLRPGFPIAEIAADGSAVITKHTGTGGAVTVGTVTAQLLYEVTGPRYLGPDATLRLDSVTLHDDGPDRVCVAGVRGEAPPPTLKVSTTTLGGFRNEMTFLLTGLDIAAKADLVERQMRDRLDPEPAELEFRLARTDHPDADTQAAATAQLTVVAWDDDPQVVGRNFSGTAVELALASYPGASLTAPPGKAAPYGVYRPAYIEAEAVAHEVVLPNGEAVVIKHPVDTGADDQPDGADQPDGPIAAVPGPTRRAPLGLVAAARSGDKGGDANIGVWVQSDQAYAWLRGELSAARLRELLPETADLPLRRYELPNLRAINFVIEGLLGKGVAHGYRFDPQAKGLAEWLRSRHVDIPEALLED